MSLHVNIGGAYKGMSDGWVNINGVWKKIDSIHNNINGVWKEGYSAYTPLGAISIGSIVYDVNSWEFKTGSGYTGTGTVKEVEWMVLAHNYFGAGTTALIAKECVCKYPINTPAGVQRAWASTDMRTFLRGTFYNHLSAAFRTNLPALNVITSGVTNSETIFLLSSGEANGGISYFSSDALRIAKFYGSAVSNWLRTSLGANTNYYERIEDNGTIAYDTDESPYPSVRPLTNLYSTAPFIKMPDGRYKIKT